jgi:hypothetical protein
MTRAGNGTKVFIAGSRRLSRLNADVKSRLDNIIEKGFTVVVGDANGADKAVQQYLASAGYQQVVVFCMSGKCRNNIGHWPAREIAAAPGARGFEFYSAKDRAMGEEADYGLMLWDGQSRGTLTNIVDLVRQGKPVVVYVAPAGDFYTLRQSEQLAEMVRRFDPEAVGRIDRELQVAAAHGPGRKANAAPLF